MKISHILKNLFYVSVLIANLIFAITYRSIPNMFISYFIMIGYIYTEVRGKRSR